MIGAGEGSIWIIGGAAIGCAGCVGCAAGNALVGGVAKSGGGAACRTIGGYGGGVGTTGCGGTGGGLFVGKLAVEVVEYATNEAGAAETVFGGQ